MTIQTEDAAEDLCDHLEDPERCLSIFVVAAAVARKLVLIADALCKSRQPSRDTVA